MKSLPLVSIVIPVYNVEQYLDECMKSIFKQTYSKLDIILVDDGSKDSSPEMCDEYARKDSRVQVVHKANGGLVSAWMAGVEASKGEYLVFVDSDDWIDLDMIEELVKYSCGQKREIICSNYIIEKENKSIYVKQSMEPGIYDRKEILEKIHPHIMGLENRRIHCSRCMKLFSKALIVENMKYAKKEITMGEDMNITFSAILDAERIVVVEEGYYYHYRLVESSMIHKYNPKLYDNNKFLYKTLRGIVESKNKEEKIKEKAMLLNGLQKEYIFLLFYVLKNELRGPWKGCAARIKRIVREARQESGIHQVKVRVKNKANMLLYLILKYPNTFNVTLGKAAIEVFDRL